MSNEGDALRERLREIGRVKAESAAEDAREHLAMPVSERLRRVLALSDEMLRLLPARADAGDDEAEVWARVQERLRARATRPPVTTGRG